MPIIIDQFNVNSGIVKKYKDALHSNTKWHKVIVENVGDLDKLTVLNTIMKFCYPLHFIPVHYQSCNNMAHFLLKNCGSAIERICNQNLIIKHPCTNKQSFKLSIHLSTASTDDVKINIQDNVMKILYKRFNSQKGLLDLDNFVSDPDLEEFCPLSQPKLLFYIFHLSKNLPIKYLKLSNNQIESLKAMEGLSGMTTLIGVDLHNNGISSMAEITYLREFQLEELCLDGNPLCDKCDEFSYGKDAKRFLPTLKKIDGYRIQSNPFLQHRRNYVCSQTGFDLVDQFLEHYFTLYDADNRSVLDGLYHEEAIFSLTASFKPMQSTSTNARLQAYNKVSRNLMNLATFTGTDEFLFAGPSDILKVLCSLPQSEHDPFSFNVDLISYTEKMAILIVSGIFREMKETLLEEDRLLYFTRTFVLRAGNAGEYTILNEMVHISNATTFQASIAFKKVRAPTDDYIPIPRPKNTEEMLEILRAIETLTGMNREWSKKCLEECHFILEKALALFVELYKMDKIPSTAFDIETRPGTKLHPQFSMGRMLHSSTIEIDDEEDPSKINLKSILNEPHHFSQDPESAPSTIVHPILGKIETSNFIIPTVSTSKNVPQFIPPPSGSVHNQIPPRLSGVTQSTFHNIQSTPFATNIQSVNFPIVPPVRNPMPFPMPVMPGLQPMINTLKPIVHPLRDVQSQINQPLAGNFQGIVQPRHVLAQNIQSIIAVRQKAAARVSLINIQLNK